MDAYYCMLLTVLSKSVRLDLSVCGSEAIRSCTHTGAGERQFITLCLKGASYEHL